MCPPHHHRHHRVGGKQKAQEGWLQTLREERIQASVRGASGGQSLSPQAGNFHSQRQEQKSTDAVHRQSRRGCYGMDLLSGDLGSGFGTLPMSPLCLEVFLWKPSFCVFPLPQIYLKINCESDACFHQCCNEQFPSKTQPTPAPEQAGSMSCAGRHHPCK